MKKIIALSGALALALSAAGCAEMPQPLKNLTTDIATAQQEIVQDLPSACTALSVADAAFQTIAATQATVGKPLASSVIKNENTAMAAVVTLCANPAAFASTAGTLTTALAAYSAIMQSLAAAKSGQ